MPSARKCVQLLRAKGDINAMFAVRRARILRHDQERAPLAARVPTASRFEKLPSSTRRGNMKTACLPRAVTRGRGEGLI